MQKFSISLTVKDGFAALDFYKKAIGAEPIFILGEPGQGFHHGEFTAYGIKFYMSDEAPDYHAYSMPEGQMSSCLLCIECDDPDASFAQAVAAGATSLSEPQDYFWGERAGNVSDPFGYRWCFTKRIEEVSHDEVRARAAKLFGA